MTLCVNPRDQSHETDRPRWDVGRLEIPFEVADKLIQMGSLGETTTT
jgi:hypothetical protein